MSFIDRAKQAQQAYKIQKMLNAISVEAERLNGKVKVTMNGSFKPTDIKIDEALLSPEHSFELEKALKDALGEAHSKAQNAMAAKAKEMGLGGL
jgi:DNA-binding protein YbaB